MSYLDNIADLRQDTKSFKTSAYGKYIITTIQETAEGYLAKADDVECPYPERYLAKHSALKEVLNLIDSPLDDDTPTRG